MIVPLFGISGRQRGRSKTRWRERVEGERGEKGVDERRDGFEDGKRRDFGRMGVHMDGATPYRT